MGTYFGFSDECGDYQRDMSDRAMQQHPFYIRSTLLINSAEWQSLNYQFKQLKRKYSILFSKELKWSHLWRLRHFQNNKKTIPPGHELRLFKYFDYHDLIDFVEESIALINNLEEKKIIITYTRNEKPSAIDEKFMLGMHLQEHMQRIEMELSQGVGNLGVLFFDPVSKTKNECGCCTTNFYFLLRSTTLNYGRQKDI